MQQAVYVFSVMTPSARANPVPLIEAISGTLAQPRYNTTATIEHRRTVFMAIVAGWIMSGNKRAYPSYELRRVGLAIASASIIVVKWNGQMPSDTCPPLLSLTGWKCIAFRLKRAPERRFQKP